MSSNPKPAKRAKTALQAAAEEADELVVDANDVITFHLADPTSHGELRELVGDDGEEKGFGPLMCHQVFGDEEEVREGEITSVQLTTRHGATRHSARDQSRRRAAGA